MQIDIRIRSIRIECGLGPSLIHQNVWNMMFGCKINIILIGIQIASCHKIHIRSIGQSSTPPFPCHLSGLYPTGFFYLRRSGQTAGHCIFYQLSIRLGNYKITPWEIPASFSARNVICCFQDSQIAVTVFSISKRYSWKHSMYSISIRTFQKHTGIIRQIGFTD